MFYISLQQCIITSHLYIFMYQQSHCKYRVNLFRPIACVIYRNQIKFYLQISLFWVNMQHIFTFNSQWFTWLQKHSITISLPQDNCFIYVILHIIPCDSVTVNNVCISQVFKATFLYQKLGELTYTQFLNSPFYHKFYP